VVWSEPNISQIEALSSKIYAWYQEFEFDFFLEFQTEVAKIKKINLNKKNGNTLFFYFYLKINL
jgi:hypothetical protein